MIAIKIILAILFAFMLFIGAFLAISTWIFDKVEISDHIERMQLQKVHARKVNTRRKRLYIN